MNPHIKTLVNYAINSYGTCLFTPKLGTTLLATTNEVFTGCSECSAFCSEHYAFNKALQKGITQFHLVIIVSEDGERTPCQGCLDKLKQKSPEIMVVTAKPNHEIIRIKTISEIINRTIMPATNFAFCFQLPQKNKKMRPPIIPTQKPRV